METVSNWPLKKSDKTKGKIKRVFGFFKNKWDERGRIEFIKFNRV